MGMWGGKDWVLKVLVSSESAALLFLQKTKQNKTNPNQPKQTKNPLRFNAVFKANERMVAFQHTRV